MLLMLPRHVTANRIATAIYGVVALRGAFDTLAFAAIRLLR